MSPKSKHHLQNKHMLFAKGEAALTATANANLFDMLPIKKTCQFRQLSKKWQIFVDNTPDNSLLLAKKFDLVDDYHAYLNAAIQDDIVLVQDHSWESMFALFAKQKNEIKAKIETLKSDNFNDWDSPDLGLNSNSLQEDKKQQLGIWLLRHAAKGDFVGVHYLLQAGAPITLRKNDEQFHLTTWSNPKKSALGTALDGAAYWGSLACTKILYKNLQAQQKEFRILDDDFFTPLHLLAISLNTHHYLNPDLVKFYVNHGIDINLQARYHLRTALHYAVLEYPLHALMFLATDKKTGKPITHEMRCNLQKESKEVFFDKLNIDLDEMSINEAAWKKSLQMIDTLINCGANLYAKDKYGMQPIDYARKPAMFLEEKFNARGKSCLKFLAKSFFEECWKTKDKRRLKVARFAILCGNKLCNYLTEKMQQIPEEFSTKQKRTVEINLRISRN